MLKDKVMAKAKWKLLGLALALLGGPALGQGVPSGAQSRAALQTTINTNLPTSNSGLINALALRNTLVPIINSMYNWITDGFAAQVLVDSFKLPGDPNRCAPLDYPLQSD